MIIIDKNGYLHLHDEKDTVVFATDYVKQLQAKIDKAIIYKFTFKVLEKEKYDDFSDVKHAKKIIIYSENVLNAKEQIKKLVPINKIVSWNCEQILKEGNDE